MNSRILHVEDNPDDVMLTGLAFRKAGSPAKLMVVEDGEKAVCALEGAGDDDSPDLVLLDVKLPSMSGLEVLAWIRSQPRYKRLPVVMLTSSQLPDDITSAYDLGANSYLVKPAQLSALVELAGTIQNYWLNTNVPPPVNT
jgi:two-component system response regulator